MARQLYRDEYDIHNCDKEPIHSIQSVQSFAELLICDHDLATWHYATDLIQDQLKQLSIRQVIKKLTGVEDISTHETRHYTHCQSFDLIVYHEADYVILEFERVIDDATDTVNKEFKQSTLSLLSENTLQEFLNSAVDQVKSIIQFDRVMLYQFDQDGSGKVTMERLDEGMQPYLGLKFPASDIPNQARVLYKKNQIRSVYDIDQTRKYLNPNPNQESLPELNLSQANSRGVSPIHVEYLKNMGVNSTFSLAINHNDQLWGLIACHHRSPRYLSYKERDWLSFLSKMICNYLSLMIKGDKALSSIQYQLLKGSLIMNIRQAQDLISALTENMDELLESFSADGMSISIKSRFRQSGAHLPETLSYQLAQELHQGAQDNTIQYADELPDAYKNESNIAGYLYIPLAATSDNFLIFYRREKKMVEQWAGDPTKSKSFDPKINRLSPRHSFDIWKIEVKGKSTPWSHIEIQRAEMLRDNIQRALYQRFAELESLYKKLEIAYTQLEHYSDVLSHDLKSPLRYIRHYSRMLKEDYEDKLDEEGISLLESISRSADKMKNYIEGILKYSKLSKTELKSQKIDLTKIVKDDISELQLNYPDTSFEYEIAVSGVMADELMMMQMVHNLLDNAAKYSHKVDHPKVSISAKEIEDTIAIDVSDNGIGIPEKMRKKVFDIYKRCVSDTEFSGTGIGLSIVQNIVKRHHGSITISTNEPEGTIVSVRLPKDLEIDKLLNALK